MVSSRVQWIGFGRQNACIAHFVESENLLLTCSNGQHYSIDYRADQSLNAIARQRKIVSRLG